MNEASKDPSVSPEQGADDHLLNQRFVKSALGKLEERLDLLQVFADSGGESPIEIEDDDATPAPVQADPTEEEKATTGTVSNSGGAEASVSGRAVAVDRPSMTRPGAIGGADSTRPAVILTQTRSQFDWNLFFQRWSGPLITATVALGVMAFVTGAFLFLGEQGDGKTETTRTQSSHEAAPRAGRSRSTKPPTHKSKAILAEEVKRYETDADGNTVMIMADGTRRVMTKKERYGKAYDVESGNVDKGIFDPDKISEQRARENAKLATGSVADNAAADRKRRGTDKISVEAFEARQKELMTDRKQLYKKQKDIGKMLGLFNMGANRKTDHPDKRKPRKAPDMKNNPLVKSNPFLKTGDEADTIKQMEMLEYINKMRAKAGFPPQTLDEARSAAARALTLRPALPKDGADTPPAPVKEATDDAE